MEKSAQRGMVDTLSERLAAFGCHHTTRFSPDRSTGPRSDPADRRKVPTPMLKAVYVGGPSAVGKSAALKNVSDRYPWARVSNVNFRNLFQLYNGDAARAAHHLVVYRGTPMIYEHTDECTVLYRVVHEYMHRKTPPAMMKEAIHSCYRDCVDSLTNPSANRLVIVLDTTKAFVDRYESRLATDYNGIDFKDRRYLYFQIAAYLAFLARRNLFPFMTVLIATDDVSISRETKPCMFGEDDTYSVMSLLHLLIDTKNDIVMNCLDLDVVSSVVADCHLSRADETLELS